MRVVVLVAFALLLSGCSQSAEETTDDAGSPPTSDGGVPPLSGWVFDPAVAPVVGAEVAIPSLNATAATDDQGRYGFDDVPANQVLVVIVTAEGYKPSSKSLQLDPGTQVRLNFTLQPVAEKEAYHETQAFTGMIDCSGVVRIEEDRHDIPCGGIDVGVDNRVWEFNVKEDLAGVIIEVAWEPQTSAADHLNLTIETVGAGNLDEILFSQEGGNILRGQISNFDAKRFYAGGGTVRVTVDIGRNIDDDEVGVGAGWTAQQEFEVFATAFYVEPPPSNFSIADAA